MSLSTANSWKIGLAVAALALPLAQSQAFADEEPSEPLEAQSVPLEPKSVRVILLPAADEAVFAPQRQVLADDVPVIMVQPVRSRATEQPASEPPETLEEAKSQEDAALAESPPEQDPPPRVASLPTISDAANVSPRPEPEKTKKAAAPVLIPALPGRSPFRATPFKSEIVETQPGDAANVQQAASEPFAASIEQAEAAPESDKPPIKRLLDGLQFWKN